MGPWSMSAWERRIGNPARSSETLGLHATLSATGVEARKGRRAQRSCRWRAAGPLNVCCVFGVRGDFGPIASCEQALLSTTERVVQQIDSVEYGLTDIQV